MWSYNEQTQKNELKTVEHVFINEDDYITTLELFDPETRKNETITTTPEHPFYVSSKEKEPWTGAGELEVEDEIRKADGNVGIVLFVRTKLQKKTMYNLSVSDNHNFFVGQEGWLTHNASKPLTEDQIEKYIQALRNGGTVGVKSTSHARQILDAIPGMRPLPQQFAMEDSIFKYPTFRGDLVNTTAEGYGKYIHNPKDVGNPLHAKTPHYNVRFPKSQNGRKGTIIINGC